MAMESSYCFDDLPEDCIAKVLSLTTPKDACRLSAIADNFRSAARSDAVWETFLPRDYQRIISRSVEELRSFHSKKELYLFLCDNQILIDGGLKSFWLGKACGAKCYMLAARDLGITWGNTPAYWLWIRHSESRFAEVAELVDVCWLDICGNIDLSMLSVDIKYAAYLVYSYKSVRGFSSIPVEASVTMTGQEKETNIICLDTPDHSDTHYHYHYHDLPSDTHYPKERDDGWIEVELGHFTVNAGEGEDGRLAIRVSEMEILNWKSGILIQGIEIRPKPDVV